MHADKGKKEPGHARHESYFHREGHTELEIPPGHYPPPGECRIWYPGRPPGQQPPPGTCGRLRGRVPRGAWLIEHPADTPEEVHVVVYDRVRPRRIVVVGVFDLESRRFVRELERR